jgi:hypothetical protein
VCIKLTATDNFVPWTINHQPILSLSTYNAIKSGVIIPGRLLAWKT